jgi:phage gp29-like protein
MPNIPYPEDVITQQLTVVNDRYQPAAIAHTISADTLLAIFRAAEGGDTGDYFTLLRDVLVSDNLIQGLFATRKLAVIGNQIAIPPRDKKKPEDVALAARIQEMIEDYDEQPPAALQSQPADLRAGQISNLKSEIFETRTPWLNALAALMDGHLMPVSVMEKVWRPSTKPGLRFQLAALVPVPHHLLDYTLGHLRIKDVDSNGAPAGTTHYADPERYIVHRGHLLSLPDNWGGPMRSILVWWLLMTMSRGWWARALERWGTPFPVGKFESGDDDSRRILQSAFALAVRLGGLVVSKNTEVELIQAASRQTGEAFNIFREVGRKEIAQAVLGQSGTTEGTPGKLGEEKSQEQVRQDFVLWDETALGRTLKHQLFAQFARYNGLRGSAPTPVFGFITPAQQTALGTMLKSFKDAGLEPTDEAIITISDQSGIALQRAATPVPNLQSQISNPPTFGARLFTPASGADPTGVDALARDRAADLAQAFRGSLAPIRRIVLESTSPLDLERRLRLYYPDWSADRVAAVLEDALAILSARATPFAAARPS